MKKGYYIKKGKFIASVKYKKVTFSLGTYEKEEDAREIYRKAIEIIKSRINIEDKLLKISKTKISPPENCWFDSSKKKFIVSIRIGSFKTEKEAIDARDKAISKLELNSRMLK